MNFSINRNDIAIRIAVRMGYTAIYRQITERKVVES